jgi:catechol 2,3-dioxygenase-like lactoylglutathione lyase family enzyme
METIIARLLQDFEEGKVNRRQLIRNLAAAAGSASIVGSIPASAAEGTPVKVTKINHLSYRVANYAKTRDFYSGVLGMKTSDDDGKEKCSLAIGDVHIHVNGSKDPLHEVGGKSIPLHTPYVDHIDYDTESGKDAILAELNRRGLRSQAKGSSFRIKDPDGFDVTLSAKR